MSVETAKAHYIGKPGFNKLNCVQTIANALKDKFKEIRSLNKLSCVGCVETVASHIEDA
jgi:hypothetical protein